MKSNFIYVIYILYLLSIRTTNECIFCKYYGNGIFSACFYLSPSQDILLNSKASNMLYLLIKAQTSSDCPVPFNYNYWASLEW